MLKEHNKISLLPIWVAVVLLSGCAATVTYVKNGAVPGEWEQARAECMVAASKQVPPDNRYSVLPGQEFQNRNCNSKGCNSYSNFSPPQIQTVDANEDVRKAVYQACLAKHGWTPTTAN